MVPTQGKLNNTVLVQLTLTQVEPVSLLMMLFFALTLLLVFSMWVIYLGLHLGRRGVHSVQEGFRTISNFFLGFTVSQAEGTSLCLGWICTEVVLFIVGGVNSARALESLSSTTSNSACCAPIPRSSASMKRRVSALFGWSLV